MIGPLSSPRLRPLSALHCVALTHARALDQSVRLEAFKERTKASNYLDNDNINLMTISDREAVFCEAEEKGNGKR